MGGKALGRDDRVRDGEGEGRGRKHPVCVDWE